MVPLDIPGTHTHLHHLESPSLLRVLVWCQRSSWDIPGEIKTWSGTQCDCLKEKSIRPSFSMILSTGRVHLLFGNELVPPSMPSWISIGHSNSTAFPQPTPHTLLRFSRAFLKAGGWLCQTGMGLPTGIQVRSVAGNPNNQQTHTSLSNFQPGV